MKKKIVIVTELDIYTKAKPVFIYSRSGIWWVLQDWVLIDNNLAVWNLKLNY